MSLLSRGIRRKQRKRDAARDIPEHDLKQETTDSCDTRPLSPLWLDLELDVAPVRGNVHVEWGVLDIKQIVQQHVIHCRV